MSVGVVSLPMLLVGGKGLLMRTGQQDDIVWQMIVGRASMQ